MSDKEAEAPPDQLEGPDDIARLLEAADAPAPVVEPASAEAPRADAKPDVAPEVIISTRPPRRGRRKPDISPEVWEQLKLPELAGKLWCELANTGARVVGAPELSDTERDVQGQLIAAYAKAKAPRTVNVKPEMLLLAAFALLVAPRAPQVTKASASGVRRLWGWWRKKPAPTPAPTEGGAE